jgi:hypothetical protein
MGRGELKLTFQAQVFSAPRDSDRTVNWNSVEYELFPSHIPCCKKHETLFLIKSLICIGKTKGHQNFFHISKKNLQPLAEVTRTFFDVCLKFNL